MPSHEKALVSPGKVRSTRCPTDWPGQHVPNFERWLPGDIVVVERDATALGRGLQIGQGLSFNPMMRAGLRWSHAALYAGSGDVVEAIYGDGVVRRSVWNYCQTRALRVRRLPRPFVSDAQAAAAVRFAQGLVGRRYSLKELLRSKFIPRTRPDVQELYCSTFVALTVARGTSVQLWDGPDLSPIYPSILARHPDLHDVIVEWLNL